MVLDFFRGGGDAHLEQIEGQIRQMLLDDRHTFAASTGKKEARWSGPNTNMLGFDPRTWKRPLLSSYH